MKKEGLSEFIKFAYEHGKVKEVKEAFIDYPPEKECHKGISTKTTLKEQEEIYLIYKIGDIVFVKDYCYKNGRKGKNHLFVIIDQNNIAVPIENFGLLISSNVDKLKYDSNLLIQKNLQNGLNKDSIVKTDIIYRILNNQILFKIGTVDMEKVEEYKEKFYKHNN